MGAMFTVSTRVRPGELARVGRFAVLFRAPGQDQDEPREVAPGISSSARGAALALSGEGSYVLRQEISPSAADGKPIKKTLPTGPLQIRIGGEPERAGRAERNDYSDLATARIVWGPARSGLEAGLISLEDKNRYYVGERVRLAVILRNVSDRPISFWHETSFAFLEAPYLADGAGAKRVMKRASEPEWRTLHEIRMTGVTFDMTFAPSADGPSRFRRSEILPGKATIGYFLTAFVIPPKWSDGSAVPGRYRAVQPVRLGLADSEQLDTALEAGPLSLEIVDPH